MSNTFLEIKNLNVIYKTDLETVYALNDVSLELEKGQTLGLVGETAPERPRSRSLSWVSYPNALGT